MINLEGFSNYLSRRHMANAITRTKSENLQVALDSSIAFIISRLGSPDLDTSKKLVDLNNNLLNEAVYFYGAFLLVNASPLTNTDNQLAEAYHAKTNHLTDFALNAILQHVDILLSASGQRNISCWIDTREAV